MDVVIPYTARSAFVPFHQRTQRDAVLVCHRRMGKTVSLVNDLQLRCLGNTRVFPPPRYAFFYPTRVRAKDIAWPYMKHFSEPIPGRRVIESELAIEYPNKGRVTLYGADGARGVGLWLDGVVYDEDDDIPAAVAADIEPALADQQGWTVHAGMLRGRHNLWKRYEASRNNPAMYSMLGRASLTGIIPEKELERLRLTMGESAFEMQLECNPNASIANAIYGRQMDVARRENRICNVAWASEVPLDYFLDIGHALHGDDWSLWGIQLQNRDILLQSYLARSGELPGWYAQRMMAQWDSRGMPQGTVFLPHDGTREDRQGRSAADDLRDAGIKRIKIVPRTPVLWDSINRVRALLPRCVIDVVRCSEGWKLGEIDMPSGIDCLDYYSKKEDTTTGIITDVPVHDQYSHGADALRTFSDAVDRGMVDGTSATAKEERESTRHKVLRGPGPQSYPIHRKRQVLR